MRHLSIAAAVLTVLMAITGCTSTPDDGRIVTEGGSPARDARIDVYDFYAEQEGDDYRSAAWVDEQECVSATFAVFTEGEHLIYETHRMLAGVDFEGNHAANFQQRIDDAKEIGDTKLLRALDLVGPLAASLVRLETDMYEVADIIYAMCEPAEYRRSELDGRLDAMLGAYEELAEARVRSMEGGPLFSATTGRYDTPMPDFGQLGDLPDSIAGSGGGPEESRPAETCDDVFSDLMVAYAYGELDYEYVLQFAADDEAEEFILEHMGFAMEEVNSGEVHPDDAGTLMGQVSWGDHCNLEPFFE